MAAGAGIVVRARGRRWYVPALLVQRVMLSPRLSPIPGQPLRMALVEGRVVPVLPLGDDGNHLIVCHSDGEPLGIAGVDVEQSGFFEAADGGVRVNDEVLPQLDLAAELARTKAEA
jgi:hypothetical protein